MAIAGQTYINQIITGINIWGKFYLGQNYFYLHPYKRKSPYEKIIWQKGSAKLVTYSEKKTKPTILLIPSLINKSYIFDLKENMSLVRYLDQDVNVILLDWNNPEHDELEFDISDYIAQRLIPAISFITSQYGDISILGYCLGGLMAMAACFLTEKISSLILIATPWDFTPLKTFNYYANDCNSKSIPAYIIHHWFYQHNFDKIFSKFVNFIDIDQNSPGAENFVATEQWVRDGIDLTTKAMDQLMVEFIGNNIALNDKWQINGQIISPSNLKIPSLIVMPEMDNIVPLSSTKILTSKIPNNQHITIPSGHVGMIIGSKAKEYLWKNLRDWVVMPSSLKNN
jgi:polyhydroxyalkanoate synthase